MSSNSNTPRLRFPEFKEEWKEKKFKDITISSGKRNSHNLPYERYSISNENGFYPQNEQFEGGAGYLKNIDCSKHIIVSPKTFAYNPARINIGSIGYQNLDHDVIVSPLYEIFKTNDSCDDDFLWQWFHTEVFNRLVINGQEGGVRLCFSYNKLQQCSIKIPSLPEQQKIASCLTEMDNLIAAQGQKVGALKEKKKGLMQQLFPQPGETSPQLRFPGFTGEWEERKFGEIFEKHNVKNDLTFGINDIISVANMYYKSDVVVGDENYLRSYNIFRLGDIAYEGHKSKEYSYGRFVENTIGDGIVSHVFDVYSPKTNNHNIWYWKYAINYERIMRPILEKSTKQSTMMNNLIERDFLKQKTLVPTLPEQQTIASFLSELDNLIAAESDKLEILKNYKKGLMQQLFPQPVK